MARSPRGSGSGSPRPSAARGGQVRRGPADGRLPGVPGLQRLEPRRLARARRPALRRLRAQHRRRATAPRLRLAALRHPDHRRGARAARVPIRFTDYGDESDPGPYPVPPRARVEGGSDRHVVVVQRGRAACTSCSARGAGRGAGRRRAAPPWSLRSNRLRRGGWTSADAAGLPILPGLARADEARAGAIRHALRVTVPRSQRAYVAPARPPRLERPRPRPAADGPAPAGRRSFDLRPFRGRRW